MYLPKNKRIPLHNYNTIITFWNINIDTLLLLSSTASIQVASIVSITSFTLFLYGISTIFKTGCSKMLEYQKTGAQTLL